MMYEPKGKRRAHEKSRKGCAGCKARHIKCDEKLPICSGCLRRKIDCIYNVPRKNSPSSQPSPDSSTTSRSSSVNFDALNIELIHHFTTSTCTTLPCYRFTAPTYQVRGPKMGLTEPAVMHSILAISALHLHILNLGNDPDTDYLAVSRRNYYQAVEHVQQAVNSVVLMMSNHILSIYCLAAVTESDGCSPTAGDLNTASASYQTYFSTGRPFLVGTAPMWDSNTAGLEDPWSSLHEEIVSPSLGISEPTALLQLKEPIPDLSDSEEFVRDGDVYRRAIQQLRVGFALSSLSNHACSSILYWPAKISNEFIGFVLEERPRALVVMAYWCAFVTRYQDLWWVRQRGALDLQSIRQTLSASGCSEWLVWLEEPFSIAERNRVLFEKGDFDALSSIVV
ncbi:hypothetical protein DL96DRAFT_1678247 [Flagelloscypha sp. PMI_526]|nr:hypothetical protein DL96DRAFT_1678247 [Flagelloscypha sp. PMI_526]